MPVTIKVNGVMNTLVHKGSNGVSVATIPDVCKTPSPGGPVPIPYPNISQSATLAKGTTTIKADGMMAANKGSEFALSNGDNPGTLGGVKSSTFMKESTWITYSFDVKLQGKGAARLTDKKFQNHGNTVDLAGELQAGLSGYSGSDPTMKAACEVFCTVRQEGIDAKNKKPPTKRFDYSQRAAELSKKHPGLSGLSVEGKFLHATKLGSLADNAARLAGKPTVALSAIKTRLMKTALARAAQQTGEKIAKTAGRRLITKFIPVVNVLSTAWDIYEIGSAGYQALKEVDQLLQTYSQPGVNTYEIRPDLAKVDPTTGKPTEIYDYKFDRDPMIDGDGQKLSGYKDDWQKGQKELYDEAVGRDKVKKVDNERCKCKSK
ncbi:MAG: DUF4150 domain-containing protein [Rubrivivax sp.]|nr:MAG: DUF4150 domain-containing protein [Rubrivivax sp.]